jgi:Tol biopolymer transport system component
LRVINVLDGRSRDLIDTTADVQAAEWFNDSHRIAAIAMYGATASLVTMNADGSGMRKLTLTARPVRRGELSGRIGEVHVSPDGRYATYLGENYQSLELVDLSTGAQRTLTRAAGQISTPLWKSDSKTIRYMRIEHFPITNENRSVRDISLDGAEKIVRVFPHSQYPNVAWLIDEHHVTAFGGSTHTLVPLEGGPDQVLSRVPIQGAGYISPDGRTIALRGGRVNSYAPATKITLVSLADGAQRDIALPFADIGVMYFTPDSRNIFIRGRESANGPLTIYSVPLDGATPRVVARIDSKEFNGAFAMSPDRKSILHTVAGVRRAMFVSLDFSDGVSRILAASRKP